jgi:hypothetical protein
MQREEAEVEAERRNREDPERERFEFYAFDQSAGLSADAWDVAARLRQGPTAPATAAAAAALEEAAPAPVFHDEPATMAEEPAAVVEQPPVFHEEPHVVAEPEPFHDEPPLPEGELRPWEERPSGRVAAWRASRRDRRERDKEEGKAGPFVRAVGAAVMMSGLLWMGMVVALAVFLQPDDALSFGVYLGAGVVGLVAIALGVAIRRS